MESISIQWITTRTRTSDGTLQLWCKKTLTQLPSWFVFSFANVLFIQFSFYFVAGFICTVLAFLRSWLCECSTVLSASMLHVKCIFHCGRASLSPSKLFSMPIHAGLEIQTLGVVHLTIFPKPFTLALCTFGSKARFGIPSAPWIEDGVIRAFSFFFGYGLWNVIAQTIVHHMYK